jgi:tRNA threonylcarbamoyladenosine biosynthesis protein TsaB
MRTAPSTILLGIDTSTQLIGVALYNGSKVLGEYTWETQDHHTVELAPGIETAIQKSGLVISDLGAVGIATGPGSFTGLRIGMAFAKGLVMANKLPLVGVPTLDGLAFAQGIQRIPIAAALRAGRGRYAVAWYRRTGLKLKPAEYTRVLTPEELVSQITSKTLVCGDFSAEERQILRKNRKLIKLAAPAFCLRRPAFLSEIAWNRWQKGDTDDPESLSPLYLHYNQPALV